MNLMTCKMPTNVARGKPQNQTYECYIKGKSHVHPFNAKKCDLLDKIKVLEFKIISLLERLKN